MELNEINRAKVKKRWSKVHSAEEILIRENKKGNGHLKARVHGYLCGDGSVSIRKEKRRSGDVHHADIRFYPDHESLIRTFTEAFCRIYVKKPAVRDMGKFYFLTLTSMTAAKDLLADGSMTSLGWRVPEWVVSNERNSKEWIRAFFDCEAYVGKADLRVQSVNQPGLRQVAGMLRNFGIASREYSYQRKNKNWNTNYHLVIAKREDRKAFLNLIGFNHAVKLEKLANICRGHITRDCAGLEFGSNPKRIGAV